jgi:hypothetical protein
MIKDYMFHHHTIHFRRIYSKVNVSVGFKMPLFNEYILYVLLLFNFRKFLFRQERKNVVRTDLLTPHWSIVYATRTCKRVTQINQFTFEVYWSVRIHRLSEA